MHINSSIRLKRVAAENSFLLLAPLGPPGSSGRRTSNIGLLAQLAFKQAHPVVDKSIDEMTPRTQRYFRLRSGSTCL